MTQPEATRLDLSDCANKYEAARAFYKWVRANHQGSRPMLRGCDENADEEDQELALCPEVIWEEGPYDWPSGLTSGAGIYAGLSGKWGSKGTEIMRPTNGKWYAECTNHYTLCFVDA